MEKVRYHYGTGRRKSAVDDAAYSIELYYIGLGLPFPKAAVEYEPRTDGSTSVTFRIEEGPRMLTIMVGDGRSDFCVAGRADLVLAKGSLLQHARANDLPHYAFETFEEATALLARWLDARGETVALPQEPAQVRDE